MITVTNLTLTVFRLSSNVAKTLLKTTISPTFALSKRFLAAGESPILFPFTATGSCPVVGTSNQFNSSTVFWQMDNTGNIRSGKIMNYDTSTGKRQKNKDGKPLIHWAHSVLKIPNYNLKQCLFGLHLLNDNVKQVAIVESEKTALIMSIESPNYTWMSTGSLQGFKYEYLAPLKGTAIIAFPDKGGYAQWQKTADILNDKGFDIKVSQFLENKEYDDGWDLVDVLNYESKK